MSRDEAFMQLALDEARKGLGRTHPNPAVGAVIVKGGKVVGVGFHERAGTPHAEVHALRMAGAKAKGATIYSTLEPCNHHGRTPPCSEAIIAAGLKRVVFASPDPNPLVNGKGAKRLKAAGLEVVPHVLRAQADALNRPFFKAITTGLPFVTLKAAISLDGKLATATGDSKWISSESSRLLVHELRDRVDAIIVGAGTVQADDPKLTTRLAKGGRNALRVVLDSGLRTDPDSTIYKVRPGERTLVATTVAVGSRKAKALERRGVELLHLQGPQVNLEAVLRALVRRGCLHVVIEGGAQVFATAIAESLADEALLFVAPIVLGGDGVSWVGDLGLRLVSDAPKRVVETCALSGGDVVLRVALGQSSVPRSNKLATLK